MPKLTKKAIRYGRTDGRTDPNYRKDSLLKMQGKSSSVYARDSTMADSNIIPFHFYVWNFSLGSLKHFWEEMELV